LKMKRPSLFQGIIVAGCLTAVAFSLTMLVPRLSRWTHEAFDGILGTVTFIYILYLLAQSRRKTGRMAVGVMSAVALGGATMLGVAWPLMLCLSVGLIWLTRALYAYTSLLGAAADAFLCVLALGWAVGTLSMTRSFLWAIWCFFLGQALFPLITARGPRLIAAAGSANEADTFARAQSVAEMALRQLALRGFLSS